MRRYGICVRAPTDTDKSEINWGVPAQQTGVQSACEPNSCQDGMQARSTVEDGNGTALATLTKQVLESLGRRQMRKRVVNNLYAVW